MEHPALIEFGSICVPSSLQLLPAKDPHYTKRFPQGAVQHGRGDTVCVYVCVCVCVCVYIETAHYRSVVCIILSPLLYLIRMKVKRSFMH